jgi:hypothetical protein
MVFDEIFRKRLKAAIVGRYADRADNTDFIFVHFIDISFLFCPQNPWRN